MWSSDGTAEGTQLLIDILLLIDIFPERIVNGSPRNDGSNPENLTDIDGTLFFTANDSVNCRELWTSDGTAEGTRLVADITEGEGSSELSNFIAVGDTLYFKYQKLFFIFGQSFQDLYQLFLLV